MIYMNSITADHVGVIRGRLRQNILFSSWLEFGMEKRYCLQQKMIKRMDKFCLFRTCIAMHVTMEVVQMLER